jgi:hypothetical protein
MTRRRSLIWFLMGASLLILAVALAVVVLESGPGDTATGDGSTNDAGPAREATAGGSGGSGQRSDAGAVTKRPRRLPSAEAREQLRRAIEAARQRREQREAEAASAAGASASAPSGEDRPHGRLSKEYIRATVREVVPLIRECYENALADQDQFEGLVRAHFVIAGEPDVAGLVESAELLTGEADAGTGDADAADGGGPAPGSDLAECLQQTILSLEFPPPEGGGVVEVTYPLRFSRSDDAGPPPRDR